MIRRVLILGSSCVQEDAVKHLKETGCWVVSCSFRSSDRVHTDADRFALIDVRDAEGVKKFSQAENVDLIYSIGSDFAAETAAKVSTELGLPTFVSTSTIAIVRDKERLRDFLNENDLGAVKFKRVEHIDDPASWNIFPSIVKPTDNQGQRGVSYVRSRSELIAEVPRALKFSSTHTAIVEEFLDGPEINVNCFLINSQLQFMAISDRLVCDAPYFGIPAGHRFPSQACRTEAAREAGKLAECCMRALGIENGPVYCQIKLTSSGPRVIEIAPRLDGCHLWRLIKTVEGVDLLEATFRLFNGERYDFNRKRRQVDPCRLGFFLCPSGDEFRKADHPLPSSFQHAEYYFREGESVRPINGKLEKVGYVIERSAA